MIKYKDTSKPAKLHHGAASGQNDHKAKVTFASIVNSMLTFLFLAGVLLLVTHCQPVQASNKLGNKITLFSEKSAENNIGMPQGTGNKNHLQSVAGMGQNKDLSKIHASGKPYRYSLAFFVPKFWSASQASQDKDTTHLTQITGLNRHIMPALATSYGGVTLQNRRKLICRAVACVTESEPRHPMTFHSMANTQKTTQGGHNHA